MDIKINKQLLREIIVDQKLELQRQRGYLIGREIYKQIRKYQHSKQVLIISGLRRAGKSILMQQVREKLPQTDYYLDFDDERLLHFTVDDFQKLLEVFVELYGEQQYFYFDEIQNIRGWERFIRRLHNYGNKIIVTGSNASMLSHELGTHLTGRYYQIELYPFSFREFLTYHKIDRQDLFATSSKAKIQRYFNNYIKLGGIPEYLQLRQQEYLRTLYENILYRDIVARYKINKIAELKELVYFSASNIGKEISFNNLKNILGLGNATTVKEFFDYLRNGFLFFLVPKFDYSVKKQILANKKVYIIDTALAQTLGFRFSADSGRLLENLVFIELLRQGKDIFYHSGKKECDFIIREGRNIVTAIQVSLSLADLSVSQHEIAGITEAMHLYQLKTGLILTQDEEGEEIVTINRHKCKITIQPIWKWLLAIHY